LAYSLRHRPDRPLEIQGYENAPTDGGFVIATNHLGRLDVALALYALEGDFILPVAEKYEHHWLLVRSAMRWVASGWTVSMQMSARSGDPGADEGGRHPGHCTGRTPLEIRKPWRRENRA